MGKGGWNRSSSASLTKEPPDSCLSISLEPDPVCAPADQDPGAASAPSVEHSWGLSSRALGLGRRRGRTCWGELLFVGGERRGCFPLWHLRILTTELDKRVAEALPAAECCVFRQRNGLCQAEKSWVGYSSVCSVSLKHVLHSSLEPWLTVDVFPLHPVQKQVELSRGWFADAGVPLQNSEGTQEGAFGYHVGVLRVLLCPVTSECGVQWCVLSRTVRITQTQQNSPVGMLGVPGLRHLFTPQNSPSPALGWEHTSVWTSGG